MDKRVKEKVSQLPKGPGVYLFKDATGKIIYIGKAKVLRARVSSYFRSPTPYSGKTGQLVKHIRDFDFIVTGSELDAVLLESTLIKKHKPRYNVMLKDDKGYPYLKLTGEEFPRLEFARRPADDGAKYFGPYSSSAGVRGTLRFLQMVFPVRRCKTMKKQPCMYYHIEKCPGPCSGNIPKEEYANNIKAIEMFLDGRAGEVVRELKEEMEKAAAEMLFEKAAVLRDRIDALESVTREKQTVVMGDGRDRDIIALARDEEIACAEIMFVRGGLLTGHDPFILDIQPGQQDEEILGAFIKLYYRTSGSVPAEIIAAGPVEEKELVEEYLASRAGRKVRIHVPQRGKKKKLAENAARNAGQRLDDELRRLRATREERRKLTTAISRRVGSGGLVRRIAAFDVSTIQGTNTVGAAVTFQDARPDKNGYRKFIIRGSGRDDFSSMREMTSRYFRRVKKGDEQLPDLVVVDGGRAQVSALAEGLDIAGFRDPVIAIGYAKKSGVSHVLGESAPIVFSPDEDASRLIQMIIAEVHRFAITFHRTRRGKKMLES